MDYDFSGYATKNNLKCSDGRVILKDAFADADGQKVPLVWQHRHNEPTNVLGHAVLENLDDGVYAYCTFNESESAKSAKEAVAHGDITALSIYANQLKQKGTSVIHGAIREVSLVLSGANPGAFIDNLNFQHSDGSYEEDDSEAIIYSGEELSHADNTNNKESNEENNMPTMQEVFDTLTEEQKDVVYAMLAEALDDGDGGDAMAQSDSYEEGFVHGYEGGYNHMKKNVFEQEETKEGATLTHSEIKTIFEDAKNIGSLKESFLMHAGEYGITDIDILFPDAQSITQTPTFIKRETGWVSVVMNETYHSPFSRIKSTAADITADAARARGYVKGNLKVEEVISLLKRITVPTTIYKKQKLDRDDIIDITDMDVVSWLKAEMRMMLDEELARAILVGDGRAVDSQDKISEENIRPVYKDSELYAHPVRLASTAVTKDIIDEVIRSRVHYKGTGTPTFFTTSSVLTEMLLLVDGMGRRLYGTEAELASALRVAKIVEVPVMEDLSRVVGVDTYDLIGIMVNLKDYVVGADKGGQVSMFDDFDIDYNQYKYLMETRCSGALRDPKNALVIEKKQAVQG